MDVMPEPIQIPFIGNQGLTATVIMAHILFATFVIGATTIAVFSETLGLITHRGWYERFARFLGGILVVINSTGAFLGVTFIVLLILLWPNFWATLLRITFWPLYIEAFLFLSEAILIYVWYYTWDRMVDRKGLHLVIGWLTVLSLQSGMLMINTVASYMLTPVDPNSFFRVFFNPTRIPLDVHRFGGNFVWAAFFIGAVAAVLALRSRTNEDRAFFDRIGGFLVGIGALFLILQPMAGFSYMRALRDASWDAFERMMRGERAWVFVIVTILVSGLFLLSSWYMFLRAEHSGLARTRLYRGYKRFALAGMLLLAAVFALPYQASGGFFLSAMQPYKYLAMTGLMLFGVVNFAVYARAVEKKIRWGEGGRRPQAVLIALGILALATMLMMGYARETARNPWLIYKVMPIEGEYDEQERFLRSRTGNP